MAQQRTLNATKGHIGEHVKEANGTDMEFAAGLGLELSDGMVVAGVDSQGQAYAAGILVGDVLVGYNTTERTCKSSTEVRDLVIEYGGEIALHFNSMPKLIEPPKKREVYVAPPPKPSCDIKFLYLAIVLLVLGFIGALTCGLGNCK